MLAETLVLYNSSMKQMGLKSLRSRTALLRIRTKKVVFKAFKKGALIMTSFEKAHYILFH